MKISERIAINHTISLMVQAISTIKYDEMSRDYLMGQMRQINGFMKKESKGE